MINEESYGIIPLKKEEGEWKVLLIMHRLGNHWGFPKGKSDPNETPLQSATRELKEETGLDIEKLLRNDPIVEQYQFRRKKERVVKTVHFFPAIVCGELKLQVEEIKDARWFLVRDAFLHLTFEEARHNLHSVMTLLN